MTEVTSSDSSPQLFIHQTICNSSVREETGGSFSMPITMKSAVRSRSAVSESGVNLTRTKPHISTAMIYLRPNTMHRSLSVSARSDLTAQTTLPSMYAPSTKHHSSNIGMEVIELKETQNENNATHQSLQCIPSIIGHYEQSDSQQQSSDSYPSTPPRLPPPIPPLLVLPNLDDTPDPPRERSIPISFFLLEIGILIVIFIFCMVLVLAIREEQVDLRTTMQIVYTYIYLISIIWMIWCISDIVKFRRQWLKLTSSAYDQAEYMDIVERHPQNLSYFPDMHNAGGLFMRVGAGLLCMGSLLLTVIELSKTIEIMRTNSEAYVTHSPTYPKVVYVTRSITFIFRFLFHCVQFTFLFRYGNIVINRYHFLAKLGLIHVVIANFCTWFEAIVMETLEQLHKHSTDATSTTTVETTTESVEPITYPRIPFEIIDLFRAAPSEEPSSNESSTNALEFIEKIQSILSVYLYPCLIEYSLISVTVFYIMWRNVGKTRNPIFAHFGDRHIFTINCSRASGGLLVGGIFLLVTIVTLIPDYMLDPSIAIPITHITELVLLLVALSIVCISFVYTSKLYYDRQARVDIFDQILILITTVGDFAYTLFGLFAAIFIVEYTIQIPRFIEIFIGLLALSETFMQSAFILDALNRRTIIKKEIREKPGRELITALLLINLAIWLHDSLSAKKVKFNPLQTGYYDPGTWSIIQAFTSPLSIFYRFHSSVCLADIWQEVYYDDRNHRTQSERHTNNNQPLV